jgi:hypothetical protein
MNEAVERRLGAAPSSLGFGDPVARLALDANHFIILHSYFFLQKFDVVAGNRTRKVAVRKDLLGGKPFCC